jgi:hypothetical protein
MYEKVFNFHVVISSCFVIAGLVLVPLSLSGWLRGSIHRDRLFSRISVIFLILLYIQLVTGLGLYFFLKPDISASVSTLVEAMEQSALRFWAIEHLSLMIFALLLSQIGWFYIRELQDRARKYRSASLYYGSSFVLVLTSAGLAVFR